MSSAHEAIGQQFSNPLKREDLGDAPGASTSKQVSREEYTAMAARGQKHLNKLASNHNTVGLDRNWGDIRQHAQEAVKEPWGGATYKLSTGKPISPKANSYAVAAREPDQKPVSIPANSRPEEFQSALEQASASLPKHATHLGVFHDADKGTIDIDPVVVTRRRSTADEVGAYTRATGGAYHFRSGNGYYAPHVAD